MLVLSERPRKILFEQMYYFDGKKIGYSVNAKMIHHTVVSFIITSENPSFGTYFQDGL